MQTPRSTWTCDLKVNAYGHQSVRTAAIHYLIVIFLRHEIVIPDTFDYLEKRFHHAEYPGVEALQEK